MEIIWFHTSVIVLQDGLKLLLDLLDEQEHGALATSALDALSALCRGNTFCKNASRQLRALHTVGCMLRPRRPDDATCCACAVLADLVDSNHANQDILGDEGLLEPVVNIFAKCVAGDAAETAGKRSLTLQVGPGCKEMWAVVWIGQPINIPNCHLISMVQAERVSDSCTRFCHSWHCSPSMSITCNTSKENSSSCTGAYIRALGKAGLTR